MVFGDARGCVDIRLRRGETHVEHMLHRFHHHASSAAGAESTSSTQLDWVARHHRRPLLIVVVSDEPDVDDRLDEVLTRLTARHDVMWAMVSDMPAVGSGDDEHDGFDVADGASSSAAPHSARGSSTPIGARKQHGGNDSRSS